MVVEGREIELGDEINQEEHQVVFRQSVSWRDRFLFPPWVSWWYFLR